MPKGIYQEGEYYYLIPEDLILDKSAFYDTLEIFWNNNRGERKCIRLDAAKLYTEADADTTVSWKGNPPVMGSLYYRKYGGTDKYYVCIEPAGGSAATDPTNTYYWIDVTDIVTRDWK